MRLKTNVNIKNDPFFIGYFERYVTSKSDYLELLLSVFTKKDVCVNIHCSCRVNYFLNWLFQLYNLYILATKS